MAPWLLLAAALPAAAGEMAPILPGNLEGRPPPAEVSPLQAHLDALAARVDAALCARIVA